MLESDTGGLMNTGAGDVRKKMMQSPFFLNQNTFCALRGEMESLAVL